MSDEAQWTCGCNITAPLSMRSACTGCGHWSKKAASTEERTEAGPVAELRNELSWKLARVIAKSKDGDGKPACECDGMITCHFCIASFIVAGRYGDAADQLAKWESLADQAEAEKDESAPR